MTQLSFSINKQPHIPKYTQKSLANHRFRNTTPTSEEIRKHTHMQNFVFEMGPRGSFAPNIKDEKGQSRPNNLHAKATNPAI